MFLYGQVIQMTIGELILMLQSIEDNETEIYISIQNSHDQCLKQYGIEGLLKPCTLSKDLSILGSKLINQIASSYNHRNSPKQF